MAAIGRSPRQDEVDMRTGNLLSDLIFLALVAVPGGVLVVLAVMIAFVFVGQTLLMFRRKRAARVQGIRPALSMPGGKSRRALPW